VAVASWPDLRAPHGGSKVVVLVEASARDPEKAWPAVVSVAMLPGSVEMEPLRPPASSAESPQDAAAPAAAGPARSRTLWEKDAYATADGKDLDGFEKPAHVRVAGQVKSSMMDTISEAVKDADRINAVSAAPSQQPPACGRGADGGGARGARACCGTAAATAACAVHHSAAPTPLLPC